MDVAMLGTGKMGGAIARRLHEQGHTVHLWNRTPGRAQDVGIGTLHATPAQAAARAEVVLSVLTGTDAVREVYLGEHGALEAGGGRVYVDMTTASPEVHVEVAQAAAERGAAFVEAPVLGSIPAADSGSLVLLVGGDVAAIDRARPVLETLGELRHIGPLGAGIRLKLVANSYLAVTHAAAAELLAAGTASGLDADAVFAVLVRFVPYLEARRAGFLEHRYEPVLFRVADMAKDLGLALEVYRRAGSETPLTLVADELFTRAAQHHGELDIPAVAEIVQGA
ncbi:MAG: NAD(P)-dependent oxidoreductase [Acidimicrobiales bacterium]|jgi:3-hydroxyisobutyrate dehydrogenase-like beta-hydroxyacid dehydrogenase